MFDSLQPLPDVTKVDILLTGSWSKDNYGRHIWQGEATGQENIVGIVFLTSGDRVVWAKSNGKATDRLPVRLFLHPIRPVSTVGLSIQLMCFIGSNSIDDVHILPDSENAIPVIPASGKITTGELVPLAVFASAPIASLSVMFLAKRDVKVRRKHIWGLHDKFLTALKPPLREIFTYGRRGHFSF